MAGDHVFLDVLAEFQSVHHGHHHVRHNQVGHLFVGHLQSFLSVSSLADVVFVFEYMPQVGAYVGIVVHDEQCVAVVVGRNVVVSGRISV